MPWTNICVDAPEFTIFGALFSKHTPITHQMVMKKTPKKTKTNYLLMAHVVHYINTSENNFNYDLGKIRECALRWKLKFNLDPSKHAQERIFSRKKLFLPTQLSI